MDQAALIAAPAPLRRRRTTRQAPTIRRQDLLEVTMRCLSRLGPRATTGREICRQAGVSHGLLRHYFDNPDNLLLETYQQLCDRFLSHFADRIAESGDDAWRAIEHFCALHYTEEWASGDILGAWMSFWTLVRTRDDFRAVSDDYNERLRLLLGGIVARLPADRLALPADEAIAILMATYDGLWLDVCLAPQRMSRHRAQALCEATARTLLGGRTARVG